MTVEPGFGGQTFMERVIPKIEEASGMKEKSGYRYQIEVDGGLNIQTVKRSVEAGATIIVAGDYIFRSPDYAKAVASLRV